MVITTQARQLIPYIADAVPGWFQPVLVLHDAEGKEVAYDDDYRFNPDPTILCEVPRDGDYVLGIYDSIYRGREDFVYRITIGELPFVTSIFPIGAQAGAPVKIKATGWNLESAEMTPPAADAGPGIHLLGARNKDLVSNRVPFALDTLPECVEKEPNNTLKQAQPVTLPIIINGRMDRPNDWDVFQFSGRAGETIVAEVYARRLDSPLDSVLKLTDATGKLLAWNDDHEDLGFRLEHAPCGFVSDGQAARGRGLLHSPGRHRAQWRARNTPTGCASARRNRISLCASCPPASACAARPPPSSALCHPQGWIHRPDQARLKESPAGLFGSARSPSPAHRKWCG